MIKVVNVISDTNIGGAGKCIINFCKNYDKKKYEIVVVLPKGSALVDELKGTGVKLIEIDGLKDKSLDFGSLVKLIKVLRNERPDIVHTHASSVARIAARLVRGTKIIYTRHCAYPVSDRIKKGVGRFLYKNVNEFFADEIIAVGNAAEENLLDGGISKEKINTFFIGVEKINETTQEERRKLRKQYGIEDDEYVVGIMARLEYVKGQDTFIEAADILLKEKNIKIKFLILGNGKEEQRLKDKVKELGIEKDVIFTGFVKNVGDFLNIMDVQVNCSFGTETSCLSLLEGMSIGIPAVATDYGGNPYLISNGENGYIVPTKNPEETANAIKKILTNNDIKKRMREKAIEIYNNKFTIQTYVNNVQNVYEKVMNEPRMKKINGLDIFIIAIIAVVCIFGYSYMNRGNKVATANTQKVVYQIRTTESSPNVYEVIEDGAIIYDSLKNINIGKIVSKETTPSVRYGVDKKDKEVVETALTNKVDITLTVEADATITDKSISVNGYEIKVGNEAYVKGKGYAGIGYIVSIER